MNELGLRSKLATKFKNTTDSEDDLKVAPNLLDCKFTPLVSSIPCGFISLTIVIDLYDCKVIGWRI